MNDSDSPNFYTVNDLALLFNKKPATISRWKREGVLPTPIEFTARSYGWFRKDIEEWINQKKQS